MSSSLSSKDFGVVVGTGGEVQVDEVSMGRVGDREGADRLYQISASPRKQHLQPGLAQRNISRVYAQVWRILANLESDRGIAQRIVQSCLRKISLLTRGWIPAETHLPITPSVQPKLRSSLKINIGGIRVNGVEKKRVKPHLRVASAFRVISLSLPLNPQCACLPQRICTCG